MQKSVNYSVELNS